MPIYHSKLRPHSFVYSRIDSSSRVKSSSTATSAPDTKEITLPAVASIGREKQLWYSVAGEIDLASDVRALRPEAIAAHVDLGGGDELELILARSDLRFLRCFRFVHIWIREELTPTAEAPVPTAEGATKLVDILAKWRLLNEFESRVSPHFHGHDSLLHPLPPRKVQIKDAVVHDRDEVVLLPHDPRGNPVGVQRLCCSPNCHLDLARPVHLLEALDHRGPRDGSAGQRTIGHAQVFLVEAVHLDGILDPLRKPQGNDDPVRRKEGTIQPN
eukprot:scaffold1988_cov255-Pinguiococcus_pyrenoidosus.AAC.3